MLATFTGELKKYIIVENSRIKVFETIRTNHCLPDLLDNFELEFDLESFEVIDCGVLSLKRIETSEGKIASYKDLLGNKTKETVEYDLIITDGYNERVSYDQLKKLRHER